MSDTSRKRARVTEALRAAIVSGDLEADVDLSGNDEITQAVRALRSRSRLTGLWSKENHDAMVESAHEHVPLVDLLRQRDGDAAEELMLGPINRAASLWSKRLTTSAR